MVGTTIITMNDPLIPWSDYSRPPEETTVRELAGIMLLFLAVLGLGMASSWLLPR